MFVFVFFKCLRSCLFFFFKILIIVDVRLSFFFFSEDFFILIGCWDLLIGCWDKDLLIRLFLLFKLKENEDIFGDVCILEFVVGFFEFEYVDSKT